MSYFVEALLESIKSRSLAPISQSTFDDAKLIVMATEEMKLGLVADLIGIREDFFLAEESSALIGSVPNYPIPSRAIGNSLKDVFYVKTGSTAKKPLIRVDQERSQFYSATGEPEKYYFLGDEIVLLPTPASASGSLTFVFPSNPNDLAATTDCTKITSIATVTTTTTFTVNTDLTASLVVGDYVDFLSVKSPFKLWAYRKAITAITSTTIAVLNADVINEASTVEPIVGDYICPTGTANIPQIPVSHHSILAQMVVVRLMESLGDLNKLGSAKSTLAEMRSNGLKLIKNRVENSPEKITGRNQLRNYFR
jgi:hypothetical protein